MGESMIENRGAPDYSEYYFSPVTNDTSNLRFTWLGDILLYLVYSAGGDAGLQILCLILVFISCYLLIQITGPEYSGWSLLILMLCLLGAAQLLMIRNAFFSFLFTPLLFWMWFQVRYQNKESLIRLFPILIGVWGCIHGSYLLGFGLLLLLFLGDCIDAARGVSQISRRQIIAYITVIIVSFIAIAAWNPMTQKYFGIERVKKIFSKLDVVTSAEAGQSSKERKRVIDKFNAQEERIPSDGRKQPTGWKGLFYKIKKGLNNTIFKTSTFVILSSDFMSPFDATQLLHVKVSIFLSIIGTLGLIFFSKPIRASHLLPFSAVVFFGFGYLRMMAYIPLATVAFCFIAFRNGELRLRFHLPKILGTAAAALLTVALYVNVALGYYIPVQSGFDVFGFGRIPTFSERLPDRVLSEMKDKPVFTTIRTGGYLLLRWFPEKKVFVDGYFGSHSPDVLYDYAKLQRGEIEPDDLYYRYGIQIALVEHYKHTVNASFMKAANWLPIAIDEGLILYSYEKDVNSDPPIPKILIEVKAMQDIPFFYREYMGDKLVSFVNALLDKGRLKDAVSFLDNHQDILLLFDKLSEEEKFSRLEAAVSVLVREFGNVNSKGIYHKVQFNKAVSNHWAEDIIEHGFEVIRYFPNNFPVILTLAAELLKQKEFDQCLKVVNQTLRAKSVDEKFWNKNNSQISRIFLKLSEVKKDEKDYTAAYELLKKAFISDSTQISTKQFFENGVNIFIELNKSGRHGEAYSFLKLMEKQFSDFGRLYHLMAWQILNHSDEIFEGLNVAEKYAEKAVDLMEKYNDSKVYWAYDTMAEILFQLKKYKRAKEYETKFMLSAPMNSAKNYKERYYPSKDQGASKQ